MKTRAKTVAVVRRKGIMFVWIVINVMCMRM